jgi:hypothetical protein
MESLPCPRCRRSLEPTRGRHGLVWVCRACRAGAVTLPILRQVAPRPWVTQLWQAARHHGRPSAVVCPACTQPFTEVVGARIATTLQLQVCVRCFWVWLSLEEPGSHCAEAALPPAVGQAQVLHLGAARGESAAAGTELRDKA